MSKPSQQWFLNDDQRAMAYATMKTLERMLKDDGELPAGYIKNLSGKQLTITLPQGSIVERDLGTNGDGTIMKKDTQNVYGYATWALLIMRLKKFNQWNVIRGIIVECLQEVVSKSSKTVESQLSLSNPDILKEISELQSMFPIPARIEETPRVFKATKQPAKIEFN